ncbi:MAG: hypothetical protein RL846_38310 [Deltaproteobacteria bacterium]
MLAVLSMAGWGCGSTPRDSQPAPSSPDVRDGGRLELDDLMCVRLQSSAGGEVVEACHGGTEVMRSRTVEDGVVVVEIRSLEFDTFPAISRCGCNFQMEDHSYGITLRIEMPEGASLPYALRNGFIECRDCLTCACTFGGLVAGTVERLDPGGIVATVSTEVNTNTQRCFSFCGVEENTNPPVQVDISLSIPF